MNNAIPELLPTYVAGTLPPENVVNIKNAFAVIYDNLPPRPDVTQVAVDAMSKMGDRREKDAKAISKVLKASPNVLFPPLTPQKLADTLVLNDQVYEIQLEVDELSAYVKNLVDVTGAQGTNWAVFAKHTVDILSKAQNADAKVILEKLIKGLKEVEQEMSVNKLSKSDKEAIKERRDAEKAQKAADKLQKAAEKAQSKK
jgi:hypothetical protein